jgi:hypothetical protein
MSKAELLATMRREREQWDALIAEVGKSRMTEPGVNNTGWSIKDIIDHVGAYEMWTANQLKLAVGGAEMASDLFAPEDNDENTVDQRNDLIYKHNRSRPLDDIRARLDRNKI